MLHLSAENYIIHRRNDRNFKGKERKGMDHESVRTDLLGLDEAVKESLRIKLERDLDRLGLSVTMESSVIVPVLLLLLLEIVVLILPEPPMLERLLPMEFRVVGVG